jgi:hypothetical protein
MTKVDDLSLIFFDFYVIEFSGFQQDIDNMYNVQYTHTHMRAHTTHAPERRSAGLAVTDHATSISYSTEGQRVDINTRHRGKDDRI